MNMNMKLIIKIKTNIYIYILNIKIILKTDESHIFKLSCRSWLYLISIACLNTFTEYLNYG